MRVWMHAGIWRFHYTVLTECDWQLYIMVILHLSLCMFWWLMIGWLPWCGDVSMWNTDAYIQKRTFECRTWLNAIRPPQHLQYDIRIAYLDIMCFYRVWSFGLHLPEHMAKCTLHDQLNTLQQLFGILVVLQMISSDDVHIMFCDFT